MRDTLGVRDKGEKKTYLTLWRRHKSKCKHKDDRYYRNCRCAVWCEGTLSGKYRRHSLKTRSWERAVELAREIENGNEPEQPKSLTITEAVARLIADAEARNLNLSTLSKYKLLGKRLEEFAAREAISDLRDFGSDQARAFRESWKDSPNTVSKTLERLRSWFNFFLQNGWITVNPTRGIKPPSVKQSPTLPFTDAEVNKILTHAKPREATFFKILLHSGLRIIDAAQLRPDRVLKPDRKSFYPFIDQGRVFLYTQKTGTPVFVPLPPDVLADLSRLTLVGGFYFAVESDNPSTIAEYYRVQLLRAAESAGLKEKVRRPKRKMKVERPRNSENIRPHRFRDTFAVRLLEKGVPLETVSILLGHTDIKTTQKSYSPWVQSLQTNLELAVQKTWQTKLVRVK